jgi:hypothetical protein
MAFDPDLDIAPDVEPVFVQTLALARGFTPKEAVEHFVEVQDLTDLHRVETYLELTEPRPNG